MAMNVPLELLSHICSLACTDDGTTVKSLRLTSRYIEQVCSPMQYQSLSITRHEDLSHLVMKLHHVPDYLRRIYHLHISLPFSEPSSRLQQNVNDVISLLILASPTLETLSFSTPSDTISPVVIARVFRIPFPRLTELAVHGNYPFPNPESTKMPLLEWLHLSGNRNPYGLLPTLKDSFPNITHLRISGLSMASSFARQLESYMKAHHESAVHSSLDLEEEDWLSLRAPVTLPPIHSPLPLRLQRIFITARIGADKRLSSVKKDAAMIDTLLACIDSHMKWRGDLGRKDGLHLALDMPDEVEPASSSPSSLYTSLYEDWANRLMGGLGCWAN
ncbi:hypothetical protein AAF712_006645 [Marasmius tenuissimus]|uniref:F-box domain-containing protein n=1 Tax=Marasmius tenuissimus TaxID=585030 RepID=A0ABR2ZXR3_9AGAR